MMHQAPRLGESCLATQTIFDARARLASEVRKKHSNVKSPLCPSPQPISSGA